MGQGDTFGWYIYNSDNGQSYNIKLSALEAAASGAQPSDLNAYPAWPWHKRDLRHVDGVTGSGKRGVLYIMSAVSSLFAMRTANSWTMGAYTYQVTGAEGERRPTSHMK